MFLVELFSLVSEAWVRLLLRVNQFCVDHSCDERVKDDRTVVASVCMSEDFSQRMISIFTYQVFSDCDLRDHDQPHLLCS